MSSDALPVTVRDPLGFVTVDPAAGDVIDVSGWELVPPPKPKAYRNPAVFVTNIMLPDTAGDP